MGRIVFRSIFSYGPRSCVGRNVAMMELFCFISTLVSRLPPLDDELSGRLEN